MKIIVDSEAKKVLDDVMHQALLYNGLNNLMMVNQLISKLEIDDNSSETRELMKSKKQPTE